MILWWIGAALLLVVVVPAVALVLNRLLRPALQIRGYVDEITERVVLFPEHIDAAVAELATTRQLASQARPAIERYCSALERLL
jgi:hypothetical protein